MVGQVRSLPQSRPQAQHTAQASDEATFEAIAILARATTALAAGPRALGPHIEQLRNVGLVMGDQVDLLRARQLANEYLAAVGASPCG